MSKASALLLLLLGVLCAHWAAGDASLVPVDIALDEPDDSGFERELAVCTRQKKAYCERFEATCKRGACVCPKGKVYAPNFWGQNDGACLDLKNPSEVYLCGKPTRNSTYRDQCYGANMRCIGDKCGCKSGYDKVDSNQLESFACLPKKDKCPNSNRYCTAPNDSSITCGMRGRCKCRNVRQKWYRVTPPEVGRNERAGFCVDRSTVCENGRACRAKNYKTTCSNNRCSCPRGKRFVEHGQGKIIDWVWPDSIIYGSCIDLDQICDNGKFCQPGSGVECRKNTCICKDHSKFFFNGGPFSSIPQQHAGKCEKAAKKCGKTWCLGSNGGTDFACEGDKCVCANKREKYYREKKYEAFPDQMAGYCA